MPDNPPLFSAVFVCTGNRFRSPLAAALLGRIAQGLPVVTASYGTLDVEGLPALPEVVALAAEADIDLSSHRARPLASATLSDVDLLIGFEEAHVRAAVVDARAPRERSFTLRHLLRLVHEFPQPEHPDAHAVLTSANELRTSVRSNLSDDIRDPLGAPEKVQRQIATEIRAATLELGAVLFGVRDVALPQLAVPPKRSKLARLRFR